MTRVFFLKGHEHMEYTKKIVCLANSRRMSGRCIAGKEYISGKFGAWVRPVSSRSTAEISEEERRYENGDGPSVLDIVSIPVSAPRPQGFQTENHLIDPNFYWKKLDVLPWNHLEDALDLDKPELWVNGHKSFTGINDRVPQGIANEITSSLMLIRPENLEVVVSEVLNSKRKVHADFSYRGQHYKLTVTDPTIEKFYLAKTNGTYGIPDAYMCVSMAGEPFEGFYYKLVASIITTDLFKRST